MTTRKLAILGLMTALSTSAAYAGDLKAPFTLPSAKVLPKGVRNLSYKGVQTGADYKLDESGNEQILAEPFFKEISFKDVMDGKKDAAERAAIQQAMFTIGASENDSFGTTTGQVNVEAQAHVPVFAMGITKSLTLAVAVPVVESSVNISTGVIQGNQALHSQMIQALNDKGVSSKVAEFNDKLEDPVASKMDDYNYEPFKNETKSELGDIKLIAKQQMLNNENSRFVLTTEITLPTGKDQDVNKLVDVTSGDDQTDVGVGMAYDYIANKNLTFTAGVTYTWQLKDRNPERIPEKSDSKITPDIDFATERDLGDIFATTAGAAYRLDSGITLSGGYTFQYKQEDVYGGTEYSAERYSWLSDETEQTMHSAQASIGYDTISLFRQKKFPVPLSVSINHTRVLAGKNVVNNPLTSLDLSVFF